MSLNARRKLVEVAKVVCRELRENETEAEKILWKAIRNRNLNGTKFY
jgi:very-short-patch-repair endonuclease